MSNDSGLKAGDYVVTVFGGPRLFVSEVLTDPAGVAYAATCLWFDDTKAFHSQKFMLELLERIVPEVR